jgi:hypothetical protein
MADREEGKLHTSPLLTCVLKGAALMGCDVICPVAFDFVLGVVFRRVMNMTLVVEVRGVDRDDGPRHAACLRIPAHVIADLKSPSHSVNSSFLPEALSLNRHRQPSISPLRV